VTAIPYFNISLNVKNNWAGNINHKPTLPFSFLSQNRDLPHCGLYYHPCNLFLPCCFSVILYSSFLFTQYFNSPLDHIQVVNLASTQKKLGIFNCYSILEKALKQAGLVHNIKLE